MRWTVCLILASLLTVVGCGGPTDVTVAAIPGLNVAYLSMNNQKAPFDDVRVREAVALALDKDRIIQAAYAGRAIPAATPLPPTLPFHHADLPSRARDPERAKQLLQDAGHTLPLPITLSHGNNSRPYMPLPEEVAKQVAGDLEEAGFKVTIRKEEWANYLKIVQNGEHQMALLGWSADVADADNFLYVLLDKNNARVGDANNISFYTSEAVHERLTRARQIDDEAERARLYREAQEIIHRDVPMVPLVYTEKMIAHRNAFGPLTVEPVTHPLLRLVATPIDGRLTFVRGTDSVKLDPATVTDGESSKVVEQIYDNLIRFAPGTATVEPALATAWTRSEDGRTWTFTIREGVMFHDGTPLDAAAVVNAFERQRDPNHPHHFEEHQYAYWLDLFGFVERVELGQAPMTVVFRCTDPAPPFFLQELAVFAMGIPSPAALDKYGAELARHPVGTGPFRFVRWTPDTEIVLERNDDYWDGAPKLKEVIFQPTENATVRAERLLAGEADLIDNLDPLSIPRLKGE